MVLRAALDGPAAGVGVSVECLNLIILTFAAVILQEFVNQRAEVELESHNRLTQLNAASSLLQLTCDAVVELDSELRLTKHSRQLAALLLRDCSSSLQGVHFTDLVTEQDRKITHSQLQHFVQSQESQGQSKRTSMRAHAFHTRLVDSISSRLRTEVMQCMYTKQDGETCHLVGIRDFTDTTPYNRAADADVDGSRSADSSAVVAISASPVERSVEWARQLIPTNCTLFLEIDVERLEINAASPLLLDLVGAASNTVFPVPHTLQLLDRMHTEGRLLLEKGERPVSKLFTFDEMPVRLHPGPTADLEYISGSLQLFQAPGWLERLDGFPGHPI